MSKERLAKGKNKNSKSSQSYEILSQNGLNFTNFNSFTNINCPTLQYDSPKPLNTNNCVNPDFILSIKKINSKDETTITKGFQMLEELIQKENNEICINYVAEISDLYEKLLYHKSFFIRKRAHEIIGIYGAKVMKAISPYLNIILPHLFLGISDKQEVIHNEAKNAFNKIFTTDKAKNKIYHKYLPSVIKYYSNILNTMNEKDEYIRDRLYSTIYNSISYFIRELPDDIYEELLNNKNEGFELIVTSKLFKKLSTNDSNALIDSYLNLIESCLERKFLIVTKNDSNIIQMLIQGMNKYCSFVKYWNIIITFIKEY